MKKVKFIDLKNQKTLSLMMLSLSLAFITLLLGGCGEVAEHTSSKIVQETSGAAPIPTTNKITAKQIAHKYLLIDTHIDVPYRLQEKYEDVSLSTVDGDFDYPRALVGGLNAAFMSIYIPAELQKTGGSKALADKLIDMVEALVKKSPDKFALAYSTTELQLNFKNGLFSLLLGMENGSPIAGDFKNLKHFYDRGIRYITLTHAKANHISDSSYDSARPAHGLTIFGKKLITAMNNMGIMIDVSHISDEAFYQVMAISKVPVIASHSSARFFIPDFERNMNDKMIKLLAKNGGVIQINFGSTFISQKSAEDYKTYKTARDKFMADNQFKQESKEVAAFTQEYRQQNPQQLASIDDVVAHFDHVIKLVGIDHVGIGSDFDGVGDSLPVGLKDVSAYPNLIQGLMDKGYTEADIEKILSGNLLRVWKQVEFFAKKSKLGIKNEK